MTYYVSSGTLNPTLTHSHTPVSNKDHMVWHCVQLVMTKNEVPYMGHQICSVGAAYGMH